MAQFETSAGIEGITGKLNKRQSLATSSAIPARPPKRRSTSDGQRLAAKPHSSPRTRTTPATRRWSHVMPRN